MFDPKREAEFQVPAARPNNPEDETTLEQTPQTQTEAGSSVGGVMSARLHLVMVGETGAHVDGLEIEHTCFTTAVRPCSKRHVQKRGKINPSHHQPRKQRAAGQSATNYKHIQTGNVNATGSLPDSRSSIGDQQNGCNQTAKLPNLGLSSPLAVGQSTTHQIQKHGPRRDHVEGLNSKNSYKRYSKHASLKYRSHGQVRCADAYPNGLAQVPSDILTPDRAINAQVASSINSANLTIIPQMTETNQIGN